jgi:hypothetical protein
MGYKEAEAAEMYYTIRSLRSDAEANTWISGWPGYITQDWRGCSTQNKTITCSLFLGITQTSQGILAIETITFNESKPNDALLSIGVYNNGVKLGGDITKAAKVVYADTSTKRLQTFVSNETTVFTAGFLIRKESGDNSTSYSVLLADPSQVDSMFTQLYFLDGVFNEHFTKLVETRESASSKIVVWNVTWPKD